MRIGELAQATGVHPRMLRYYEQRGLLEPARDLNGYRAYGPHQVERVRKIRDLVDSGIPLRIVGQILPCVGERIVVDEPWPGLRDLLVEQRDKMSERAEVLLRSRDALDRYILALDSAAAHDEPQSS